MSLSSLEETDLIKNDLEIFNATKEYRLAQLGGPALSIIAKHLGLTSYLNFFFEHNKSTAEYHSNYHSICVALNCYEGARRLQLSLSETRIVVLAGIFHDYNHSGGILTDDKNIDIAIEGLTLAYNQIGLEACEAALQFGVLAPLLTPEEIAKTIQTLRITKYPYETDPITITEMIIRDADLMQPYEENVSVLKNQYEGLRIEMERTYPMKFTAKEFVVGLRDWLDQNVKWHTTWAINKAVYRDWIKIKQRLFETMNGA